MTDNLFFVYWVKKTLHSCCNIFNSIVNYSVKSYINLLFFSNILSRWFWTNIETDYNGIRCTCKHYVRFCNSTYTTMDCSNLNFVIRKLFKTLANSFNRTLYVSLNYNVKFLNITTLNLAK